MSDWNLLLCYFPDDEPFKQMRGVMELALELINDGWHDTANWVLQEYLEEVLYETYLEQQDYPESNHYNNGVGPLGT